MSALPNSAGQTIVPLGSIPITPQQILESAYKSFKNLANDIYTSFPRHLRDELYREVISNEESPFRNGSDNSNAGKLFANSITNSESPLANGTLSDIVENLGLTLKQKKDLYYLFANKMADIIDKHERAGGKRKSHTRKHGRKTIRRRKSSKYSRRR
jgi:hypothetical protein